MSKYKLEDLKVGAVFKESGGSGTIIRTIIAVGETNVFYSYPTASNRAEGACSIGGFLNGNRGELVKPIKKVTLVEYGNKDSIGLRSWCKKEYWDSVESAISGNKLVRVFEIESEVDDEDFPICEAFWKKIEEDDLLKRAREALELYGRGENEQI